MNDSQEEVGVSSGRLELCLNQAWGTVCGEEFGHTEATVACSQMEGFSGEGILLYRVYFRNCPNFTHTIQNVKHHTCFIINKMGAK